MPIGRMRVLICVVILVALTYAMLPVVDADDDAPLSFCPTGDDSCTSDARRLQDKLAGETYSKRIKKHLPDAIYKLQHPKDCKKAKIMQYELGSQGMMAIFRNTAICFMAAIKMGRTFVMEGGMGYYIQHAACKGKGYRCLFQAESSCTSKHWKKSEEVRMDQLDMSTDNARVIRTDVVQCRLIITEDGKNYSKNHIGTDAWDRFLPAEYTDKFNLFEWYSTVEAYLLRPSDMVAGHITRLKQQLKYPEQGKGVISIHVRHGDKSRENGVNFTYAAYYEKALELYDAFKGTEYEPTTIYLASDDKQVILDAKALHGETCPQPEGSSKRCFELMMMPDNSLWMDGVSHHGELSTKIRSNGLEYQRFPGLEVVTDVILLSEGTFMIGTCTSGVSSVAASIMVATRGDKMPHLPIRLDGNQCWGSQWFPDSNTGGWADTVVRPGHNKADL